MKLLSSEEIQNTLKGLPGDWEYNEKSKEISCLFPFKSYYKNIAFVNAVAWMAQKEGHHPDLEVSFGKCLVRYTTHDAGGVTEKDIRCAKLASSLYN